MSMIAKVRRKCSQEVVQGGHCDQLENLGVYMGLTLSSPVFPSADQARVCLVSGKKLWLSRRKRWA